MPLKFIKRILSHWTILLKHCSVYVGSSTKDGTCSETLFICASRRCWDETGFFVSHGSALFNRSSSAWPLRQHFPISSAKPACLEASFDKLPISLGPFSTCRCIMSSAAKLSARHSDNSFPFSLKLSSFFQKLSLTASPPHGPSSCRWQSPQRPFSFCLSPIHRPGKFFMILLRRVPLVVSKSVSDIHSWLRYKLLKTEWFQTRISYIVSPSFVCEEFAWGIMGTISHSTRFGSLVED